MDMLYWRKQKLPLFVQRDHGEDERSGSEGSEDDDYVPYVPVKIRKHQMVSYCEPLCLTLLADSWIEQSILNSFFSKLDTFIKPQHCESDI